MDKKNVSRILNIAIICLIILEIILSGLLAHHNLQGRNLCIVGESCDFVQNSSYGQIFGIKLPYIAIFAFAGLLIIFYAKPKLFFAAASIGLLVSLSLITIQVFILKQTCSSCILVDIAMILIFCISLVKFFYERKHKPEE